MFNVDLLLKLLNKCKSKQEMHIKTIMTFLPPKLAQIFKLIILIVGKGTGKQEFLYFAEGNINWQILSGRYLGKYVQKP